MLNLIHKANDTFPPPKIVVSGVQGIGKTTLGATFDRPILLPVEDGATMIDIDSFPRLTTFQMVVDAINALHGEQPFKTVLIDSLDWLETLVWDEVCRHHGCETIEQVLKGYGKGYTEALKWWRHIMTGFDSLRSTKGMAIVALGHTEVKTIQPPDQDIYDRYQLRLHKSANALWQEWADAVLFLNYKVTINKEDAGFNKERKRGVGSGDRMIYTSERPAYQAKNRYDLPEEIFIGKDKGWKAFHEAMSTATSGKYVNPIEKETSK